MNQAILQLKDVLNNHKNDEMQNYLKNLIGTEANEYVLWKLTRKISQPQTQNPPIRASGQKITWKKLEPQPPDDNIVFENELRQCLESLELPVEKITMNQVKRIITKINPPGFDLNKVKIPKLSWKGLQYLTGYFSILCKVAKIVLIPERGKPLDHIKPHRPISL